MSDEIDLTRIDDEYEATPRAESAEPPDGKYRVVVEKVELAKARTSGNPMLRWQLRIVGGPQEGRMLFRNNVMGTRENLAWLKKDLHTCGLDLDKLSTLRDRMEELLDIELEVTKRTRGDRVNVFIGKRLEKSAPAAAQGGDDDVPF